MDNVRVDRTAIWAGTVLFVALTLAPTPAVAADHGPEARQPMPMTQHPREEVSILNGPKIDPNG